MDTKKTILIDIDYLLSNKLSMEEYLILYSIATKNKRLISDYVKECNKIGTSVFKNLEERGFIQIKNNKDDKIFFELLSLTSSVDNFEKCLSHVKLEYDTEQNHNQDLEKQFGEFLQIYPKKVTDGIRKRPLHQNLAKCKKLYEKLLMETTHEILCKTAEIYVREKFESRSQMFIQLLETWLNQKNYLQYVDEISDSSSNSKDNFIDDI